MNKYVYQIQGALEDHNHNLLGLRVLVCNAQHFDSVDVPIGILDKETAKYLAFRLQLTDDALVIQRLPNNIINKIRLLLGKYLDKWVLENFYGDISKTKGVNP